MPVTQDYQLFVLDNDSRVVNPEAIVANGVDVDAIAPQIIEQIEHYPLGTISCVLVYDEASVFAARFTVKDYLDGNIPKRI